MDKPKRKNIRLKGYNYSRNGAYFVTICTQNKMCIFWENYGKYQPLTDTIKNVGAHSVRPQNAHRIHLSEYGIAVKNSFKIVSEYYPMIYFDKYVIMPNHIHVIIRISTNYLSEDINGRTECAPTISQVIKNLKENVTRKIGFSVWQKSFHDRILRNEYEYCDAWRYIENNPLNWENDKLFSKD